MGLDKVARERVDHRLLDRLLLHPAHVEGGLTGGGRGRQLKIRSFLIRPYYGSLLRSKTLYGRIN